MKRKNEQTDSTSPDANAQSSSSGQATSPKDLSPEIIPAENDLATHPLDTAAEGIAADSHDAQYAPADGPAAHSGAPDIAAAVTPTIVLPLSPFGPEEWESVELPPVALHVAGSKYSVRLTICIKEEALDAPDVRSCSQISTPAVNDRKPRSSSAERNRPAADEPRIHVCIRRAAFEKLRSTVGSHPPERGGIFVGADPFLLEDFIFDRTSNPAGAVYYPNTKYLNDVLARDHEPYGGCTFRSSRIITTARGHTAFVVGERLPASIGRRGSIEFQHSGNGTITGLGLRFSATGSFTSVPAVPIAARQ